MKELTLKFLNFSLSVLVLGVLLFSIESKCQENSFDFKLDSLDKYFKIMMEDWTDISGFAVGIVKDTSIVFLKGYGYRDIEKELPVDGNTVFGLASVSKGITALSIGVLQDEEVLNIDEPIINYLPNFRMYNDNLTKRVTLKDMLTHRTGLPRHPVGWIVQRDREYLYYSLPYLEPTYDLREKYQYTNLMIGVAGYIGEKMANSTYENIVKSKILEPLEMNATEFYSPELFKRNNIALPYEFDYKNNTFNINKLEMNQPTANAKNPSGGLFSSAADMCNYIIMNLNEGKFNNKQVVSENYMKEAHSLQVGNSSGLWGLNELGYGLGWSIYENEGKLLIGHAGGGLGYGVRLTLIPSEGLGFIVMTNHRNYVDLLIERVLIDTFFEHEFFDWSDFGYNRWRKRYVEEANREEASEKESAVGAIDNPSQYKGIYNHPAYGTFKLLVENNLLFGMYDNQVRFEIVQGDNDIFRFKSDNFILETRQLKFNKNKSGFIENLSVDLNPAIAPIVFQRKSK